MWQEVHKSRMHHLADSSPLQLKEETASFSAMTVPLQLELPAGKEFSDVHVFWPMLGFHSKVLQSSTNCNFEGRISVVPCLHFFNLSWFNVQ